MKNSLFIKICLIVIIILLGLNLFFSHSNSNRYSVYVIKDDSTYGSDYLIKLDKETGRIWYLNIHGKYAGEAIEYPTKIVELGKKP